MILKRQGMILDSLHTHSKPSVHPLSSQLARWQRPSAWRDLGSGSMGFDAASVHRAPHRARARRRKKSSRRLCLEDRYGNLGRRVRGCVSGVYLLASRKHCVSQCICSQFLCISHLGPPPADCNPRTRRSASAPGAPKLLLDLPAKAGSVSQSVSFATGYEGGGGGM